MPSTQTRRAAKAALAVLSVAIVLYSLIIVQQVLLGILVGVVPWILYLFLRLLWALERIATAMEQRAEMDRRQARPPVGEDSHAGDHQRPRGTGEEASSRSE
ncbi:hypothetical protein Har1130_07620 [Haloarcula sp. CBA1130]|uniref:hypothetical protein n=1 Tax=unclassified Haloarcula TaxID=2624677 RepID=UPI001243EA45|nr:MULTISPECIES: hypothetical protein [unclassified Haloarcula]KAA9397353.1 hypothetical protein Har1129_03455 [Haloarcula sp. CBA1129]KAA9404044.1 hypothetical protein Har1130_07620 [Haloarcula sp. CBA1130]